MFRVCIYTLYTGSILCILCGLGSQNRAPDLLELELRVVVSHHVSARDQTQVLRMCS